MAIKIAINGFGRIGRLCLRAIAGNESKRKLFNIVAINDLAPATMNTHLFKYDSIHGTYNGHLDVGKDYMDLGFGKINFISQADPKLLPWADLDVDIVLECSGRFASKESAMAHIEAGAKKVLISAPAKNADLTVVYGVNHNNINESHNVISNASCTTNCLAPIAQIMDEELGIASGFMTTVHAYTGDQRIIDTNHSDPRRARAAGLSMIPTSTGAAKAVGLVLPQLVGKLDGSAIRVPTANVSVVDFKFYAKNSINSSEKVNSIVKQRIEGEMVKVLGINELPLVSVDFNHDSRSSIFDATQTYVIDGNFIRVVSWYDNEWGFANRMSDTAIKLGEFI